MRELLVRSRSSTATPLPSVVPDPGRVEPEAVDVRRAAHGHEQRVAVERERLAVAPNVDRRGRAARLDADHLRAEQQAHAVAHHRLRDHGRRLGLVAREHTLAAVHERHLTPEARERLRQLAPDRAAADDHEARRAAGEREDRLVRVVRGLGESGDGRHRRARAGRDHGAPEGESRARRLDGVWCDEARLAEEHVDAKPAKARGAVDRREAGADGAQPGHRDREVRIVGGHRRARRSEGPRVRAACQARAARISALLGTHPTFRQSPPMSDRSISATRAPSPAAAAAVTSPPVPAPIDHEVIAALRGVGLVQSAGRTAARSRSSASSPARSVGWSVVASRGAPLVTAVPRRRRGAQRRRRAARGVPCASRAA